MAKNFTQGHALIVGVGGADDLPNTVDDARGIAGILKDPGRCAYPKDQVQLLTGAKAGRAAVLNGLEKLSKVRAASSVVIYFSGHGEQVNGGGDDAYYLMPHGYDLDRLDETAISGAEFAAKLSRIKSERLLVLLDCCHAGGFGGAQALPEGAKSAKKPVVRQAPLPPEALKVFGNRKGRVLIASSTGSEVSYAGEPYSVFTTALIAALCGQGAAKEDGYVRVVDLALYTTATVVRFTDDAQHPTMDFEESDNFAVAYYAGGEPKPKGLPARIKEPKVETRPGSGHYKILDQSNWSVLGDVTNVHGDQHVHHGDTTHVHGNIGFFQPNLRANKLTQVQEVVRDPQPANPRKRRR